MSDTHNFKWELSSDKQFVLFAQGVAYPSSRHIPVSLTDWNQTRMHIEFNPEGDCPFMLVCDGCEDHRYFESLQDAKDHASYLIEGMILFGHDIYPEREGAKA